MACTRRVMWLNAIQRDVADLSSTSIGSSSSDVAVVDSNGTAAAAAAEFAAPVAASQWTVAY